MRPMNALLQGKKTDSVEAAAGPAAERQLQLKGALRGMSYEQGAAALSPSADPVVQREAAREGGEEDANVAELKAKVSRLVSANFGGDYDRAFDHYAGADGIATRSDLMVMLKDAGVGNGLTRGMWADGVMKEVDADGSGGVSKAEFSQVLQG